MWSKVTKGFFVHSLESASRFYACPYDWNRENGRVEMKSKVGQCIWAINFLLECLFELFVIYRMLEMHVRDVGTAKEKINMKYTTVAYLLPYFFGFATWFRWDEFPAFINSALTISEEFKRSGGNKTPVSSANSEGQKKQEATVEDGVKNNTEPYIRYIFYLGRLAAALQAVSIFVRPQQRFLLSSISSDPKKLSWAIRLPIALFHVQMVWSLCFKVQMYTFIGLAYLSSTYLMLQRIRSGYVRQPNRAQEAFIKFYTQVQLQHSVYQRIVGRLELPFTKGDIIGVATLSIYGAIKLSGLRAATMAMIAVAAIAQLKIMYQSIADLEEWSNEALRSWRFVANNKLVMLKLKAAMPLKTRIGSLYVVPQSIVPIVMSHILDKTITLLLTF